tara:strand:+ start:4569 stop:5714 length:1146 start_codon:yes stop_codon:yes gene_type:complete
MADIENQIKEFAKSIGFDEVAITDASPFLDDEKAALERIRSGKMDGLSWYTEERVKKMNNPEILLPGAKSIISLLTSYLGDEPDPKNSLKGQMARYSWGDDYHNVIKKRLKVLCEKLPEILNTEVRTRTFVDDGPMNDRAAARRSGLGWFGKNTNILNAKFGSWVFLSQVILDVDLVKDSPLNKTCGSCVRCIDACPTGAINDSYEIDTQKCISYLTIELRGKIPINLRSLMGDWVFGCDICQDVCPVNRKAQKGNSIEFQQRPGFSTPDLIHILKMDQDEFSKTYKNSPVKRTKLIGLKRNACVALGNNKNPDAVPSLREILIDESNLLKSHAAWALGQIGGIEAMDCLKRAAKNEENADVLKEIYLAIKNCEDNQNVWV